MSLRRVMLMAQKEAWHVLRDMRTLYLALGIPFIMLLLFGYALSMDVDNVKVVVIDQDRTTASRNLIGAFAHSDSFVIAAYADDANDLDSLFKRRKVAAAILVERGFEKTLERGEEAHIQLIADGTNANDASIAIGFAAALGQNLTMELAQETLGRMGGSFSGEAPVIVKARNWFNQNLKSQWYLVPGLIAVILAMITTILMALTVAKEWELGTMEQLLVTPVRRSEIVLGKLIPYYVIGVGQLVLVASAGVLLFDVPLKGSGLTLFVAASLFLLCGLGQGLLISVITKNQQVAMQISILSSMLPVMLLSGFLSPIASMPHIVQKITYLIPARYFLVITRGVFLKGVTFDVIWLETLALLVFAIVFGIASVKRFKTRLD